MDLSSAPEIEQLRARAYDGVVQLIDQAQEAGVLRADFTDQDVVVLLMANAGLVERAHGITDEASARLTGLLLDGLRAPAATNGPAAPSARQAMAAKQHNGQRRAGCRSRPKASIGSAAGKEKRCEYRK